MAKNDTTSFITKTSTYRGGYAGVEGIMVDARSEKAG